MLLREDFYRSWTKYLFRRSNICVEEYSNWLRESLEEYLTWSREKVEEYPIWLWGGYVDERGWGEKKTDGLTELWYIKFEYGYSVLGTILNKSLKQPPTKQQLNSHTPPISETIQSRRRRHKGHYWRSKDKLISDVLLWTPTHGRASEDQPTNTYLHLLYWRISQQIDREGGGISIWLRWGSVGHLV